MENDGKSVFSSSLWCSEMSWGRKEMKESSLRFLFSLPRLSLHHGFSQRERKIWERGRVKRRGYGKRRRNILENVENPPEVVNIFIWHISLKVGNLPGQRTASATRAFIYICFFFQSLNRIFDLWKPKLKAWTWKEPRHWSWGPYNPKVM